MPYLKVPKIFIFFLYLPKKLNHKTSKTKKLTTKLQTGIQPLYKKIIMCLWFYNPSYIYLSYICLHLYHQPFLCYSKTIVKLTYNSAKRFFRGVYYLIKY